MREFKSHLGVAAPLLQSNISTDSIIPSTEIKQVSKTGLKSGLFANWRYLPSLERTPLRVANPSFVLNNPSYANASILLCGSNFGCGSSREQAVWALHEYGIRVIVAPSFGSIFYQNCLNSGLLPIVLSEEKVETLANSVVSDPQNRPIFVNLVSRFVATHDGQIFGFRINEMDRQLLLEGLDKIDATLLCRDAIEAFEATHRQAQPWVFLGDG